MVTGDTTIGKVNPCTGVTADWGTGVSFNVTGKTENSLIPSGIFGIKLFNYSNGLDPDNVWTRNLPAPPLSVPKLNYNFFDNVIPKFSNWFSKNIWKPFIGGFSYIGKGIKAITNIALRELRAGIKESDGSYLKYGIKGKWCVAFANSILKNSIGKCPWGNIYSCQGVKDWAVNHGLYKKPNINNLKEGNFIIWRPETSKKKKGVPESHIAYIKDTYFDPKTGNLTVHTIEGNSSNRVKENTYIFNKNNTPRFDGVVETSKYANNVS